MIRGAESPLLEEESLTSFSILFGSKTNGTDTSSTDYCLRDTRSKRTVTATNRTRGRFFATAENQIAPNGPQTAFAQLCIVMSTVDTAQRRSRRTRVSRAHRRRHRHRRRRHETHARLHKPRLGLYRGYAALSLVADNVVSVQSLPYVIRFWCFFWFSLFVNLITFGFVKCLD